MNRFRTKKKAKEGTQSDRRESNDEGSKPLPQLKSTKTFRIGKKSHPEPEQKPELDLASALPHNDDFRTSLLMTGLSARFSMLREQDDPTSKLGKASDDSVLTPKRQSRLFEYGFSASNGLSDIAEVSSIYSNARPRPPFAMDRVDSSYSIDGYGTDEDSTYAGSVMSRAKPAHGNNLFGGRQKIYKLPSNGTLSMKNLAEHAESGSMGGRALYDDDVSMSAFQRLRERERIQKREQEEREQQDRLRSSPPRRSSSPQLHGYNRNRETSSTTASGQSLTRSSTAATSVTSHRAPSINGASNPGTPSVYGPSHGPGLERTGTKTRRLYDTGLDQHLHSQQYSAISRLDSLSRQRTLGTRTPSPSIPSPTIATFDIPEQPEAEQSSGKPSIDSSNDARLGSFEFGTKKSENQGMPRSYILPPLSPPMSDGDDGSFLTIQPNDVGKATATGAFSKPSQPYDESRYAERQLQMQGERVQTPPLFQRPSLRQYSTEQTIRDRANSNSTYSSGRPRSSSPINHDTSTQNRGPQFKDTSVLDLESSNSTDTESNDGRTKSRPRPLQVGNGNILPSLFTLKPPEEDHPAVRERSPRLYLDFTDDVYDMQTAAEADRSQGESLKANSSADAGLGSGLSGLVRQHLRSDSNGSSIYGAPSPGMASNFRKQPENYAARNFQDHDNWINGSPAPPKFATAGLDQSRLAQTAREANPVGDEASEMSSWEKELSSHRSRSGSTATEKEREEFKNELASRRRRVQENLRNIVDSESRSASPIPTGNRSRDTSATRPAAGMNMLRHTPSRATLAGRQKENQSKAMRMLGIASPMNEPPTTTPMATSEEAFNEADPATTTEESPGRMAIDPKAIRQARRDAQRNRERDTMMRHQQTSDASGQTAHDRVSPRKTRDTSQEHMSGSTPGRAPSGPKTGWTPTTVQNPRLAGPARDRSASADTRSRSRSRSAYKEDPAKATTDGVSGSSNVPPPGDDVSGVMPISNHPAQATDSVNNEYTVPKRVFSDREATSSRPIGFQQVPPLQTDTAANFSMPRSGPHGPTSASSTPGALMSPSSEAIINATEQPWDSSDKPPTARKRSVNKADISEPTFVSSTARLTTVNLSEASPLQNINLTAPPVPDINPKRKQTRTQTMFGGVFGRSADALPPAQQHHADFENTEKIGGRVRQKLRKSSSEGGNLNARAHAAFIASPSPALPGQAVTTTKQGESLEGNMF